MRASSELSHVELNDPSQRHKPRPRTETESGEGQCRLRLHGYGVVFHIGVVCPDVCRHIRRSVEQRVSQSRLIFSSGGLDISAFAARLWGNIYYDPSKRKFSRKAQDAETSRSFVHFILEPIYKLYSQVSFDSMFLSAHIQRLGLGA